VSTPRLVVHIGAPKTGTTHLQGILWANQEALDAHGVFMPGRRQRHHFSAGNDLLGDDGTRFTRHQRRVGAWDGFERKIRSAGHPTVVFTDERLAALPAAAVAKVGALSDRREIHVVYTMRDLGSLLPSAWQENVKHGASAALRPWLDIVLDEDGPNPQLRNRFWHTHAADQVLGRWRSIVSDPAHIHVITMPGRDAGPDELWHRFAQAAGLPDALPNPSGSEGNASLDRAQVEVLRALNVELRSSLEPDQYRTWVRELLAKRALASRAVGDRPQLPAVYLPRVQELTDEMGHAIAGAGYHLVGSLDELAPRAAPAGAMAPLPVEAVRDAAIAGMAAMIHEMIDELAGSKPMSAYADESPSLARRQQAVDLARRHAVGRALLRGYRTVRLRLRGDPRT
jgi:hypothetical protein